MIRKYILVAAAAGLLWGCGNQEREQQLQSQIDSLETELQASQETAREMQEIGVLIDSIDANRQLLRADMVEGTSYKNYRQRLEDIGKYVKETQARIAELEKSAEKSQVYAATIRRLRRDLEERQQQIAGLEQEVSRMQSENRSLSRNLTERDSLISVNNETLRIREEDLAELEARVEEINLQARNDQAQAFYKQAEALEVAAQRTKFAPRKKKETQREALELYRMALSLGMEEAQQKVEQLEKDLG